MKSNIKCSHCDAIIPSRTILRFQSSSKITCPKCGGKNRIPHLWLIILLALIWLVLVAVAANYAGIQLENNHAGVLSSSPASSITRILIFVAGYIALLKGLLFAIEKASPLIKVN